MAISVFHRDPEDNGEFIPPAAGYDAEPTGPKHAKHADIPDHRRWPRVLAAIIIALIVVYGAGTAYFSTHYLPGTTIAQTDISGMDYDSASAALRAKASAYELKVTGYGFDFSLPAAKFSYTFNVTAALDRLAEQRNPFAWPVSLATGYSTALSDTSGLASYDADQLKTSLEEAVTAHNATAQDPTDARITYDKTAKKTVVTAEQYGTKIDYLATLAAAEKAAAVMSKATLTTAELVAPAVTSSDETLQSQAKMLNELGVALPDFEMTMGGTVVGKVEASNVLTWVTTDSSGNSSLDEDAVRQWANEFCSEHNTVGKDRTYTRPNDGKVITVGSGDYSTYGWLIDTDQFVADLIAAVKSGRTDTYAIPCTQEGAAYELGGQDWGKRYIDVDITMQHVWLFDENGEVIWESDCITGEDNTSKCTPTGVNTLFEKKSPMVLIGHEGNVEIYRTNVSYWLKFMECGVGLHDATWQTQGFGGTWYKQGYGSHGCVNLPLNAVAQLYELAEIGDVVITHY